MTPPPADTPPIYLDYNATTPIAPTVGDAMLPYLYERFGNPSSSHVLGREARGAVERARAHLAGLLACSSDEIVFTSGGSESNNMVIHGVARLHRGQKRHIVTSAVEHPAVLAPCRALEDEGVDVTLVGVDAVGRVDPRDVADALRDDTILVTVMHANNEVGTLQPIREIAAIAHDRGVLVHTDAAQSAGKIPTDVLALGVDFLSLAGHKLYGPKGIGALYVREGISLPPLIHGANHEQGRRAGTENVLEVVGLGRAAQLAREEMASGMHHSQALRDRLWHHLNTSDIDVRRNGDPESSLPNTLSVSFRDMNAAVLIAGLNERVLVSAGAACHAAGVSISAVLEAMNVPLEYARGTLRFSVGRPTTPEEIDEAARLVLAVARDLAPGATP